MVAKILRLTDPLLELAFGGALVLDVSRRKSYIFERRVIRNIRIKSLIIVEKF